MPTDSSRDKLLRSAIAAPRNADILPPASSGTPEAELLRKIRLFILVLGGKGGIAKSLIAQVIAASLRLTRQVRMIDTDHGNSSSASIDPDATMVDLRDTSARGALLVQLQALAALPDGAVVMDTGAQEDGLVRAVLAWLAREAGRLGITVVPVLPLTLSSHAQGQAVAFAEHAATLGLPVLLVKNLGQGRRLSDYDRWMATAARQGTLDRGAVEVDLPDLGARWSDEAAGYGLSLADVAVGRFDKAGLGLDEHRAAATVAAARGTFDANVRAWLGLILPEAGDAMLDGLAEAITKRRRLDGGRG